MVCAGQEHCSDAELAGMVAEAKSMRKYVAVKTSGGCKHECLVLDQYLSFTALFK